MFCCFRGSAYGDSVCSVDHQAGEEESNTQQNSDALQVVSTELQPFTFQQTEYQILSRRLMDMLNDMRAAGAECVLNLPVVVVCGNQSAGKSSVIESLCGVALPRSDGTCTRCPTEVRMLETSSKNLTKPCPWSCTIKLRKEVDEAGNHLIRPIERTFKENILNRNDVEKYVREAQQLLLGKKPKPVTPTSEPETLKFTRNLLVLEIVGAPVNLTLVDLPGIIHNVEKPEDAHYKGLIHDLVKEYISKETAIIVATITCKEDIETQGVLSLAREVDPKGVRTVGVLTKPDMVEEACHGQWIDVLVGKKYPLKLGYYMVKNPNQKQLLEGITFEQARDVERQFFKSSKPWKNLNQLANRFGVDALRSDLSKILVALTNRLKPGLIKEVSQKLHDDKEQLERLPTEVSDNPYSYLLSMVDEICKIINDDLLGKGDDKRFYQRMLAMFNDYRLGITKAKPRYIVGDGATVVTCTMDAAASTEEKPEGVSVMTCADVRHVIEQHRSVELPGFSPYSAVEGLITRHLATWPQLSESCLDKATAELQTYVGQQLDERFSRFPQAHNLVRNMARSLIADMHANTQQLVRGLVVMEGNNTFVLNREEFEKSTSDYLALLKAVHYRGGASDAKPSPKSFISRVPSVKTASNTLSGAAAVLVSGSEGDEVTVTVTAAADSPGTKVHTSPWGMNSADIGDEAVLNMMAVSLTYFGVASRRITDMVPLHVMHYLIGRFVTEFRNMLMSSLMVKDRATLSRLLVEDEEVVVARRRMQGQVAMLQSAMKSLQSI